MPPKQAAVGGAKFVKSNDAVADDRNWVGRIQNELNCTAMWDKDWGFLAGGAENISIDKATVNYTVDDKIRMIEDEIKKINSNETYKTVNQIYGEGANLEKFQLTDYNNTKNPDLKPQDRKLPKTYKKEKWKAPDDEFDELKNLFNKGKGKGK